MDSTHGQYMMMSLPNSGTDWLSPILAKHGGLRYYEKEYFNPICNAEHGDVLSKAFGCEMVSSYRNIGVRSGGQADQLETIYDATWARQDDWNLDKEIFSALKVPFFAEHYRRKQNCLPSLRFRRRVHAVCGQRARIST